MKEKSKRTQSQQELQASTAELLATANDFAEFTRIIQRGCVLGLGGVEVVAGGVDGRSGAETRDETRSNPGGGASREFHEKRADARVVGAQVFDSQW